MKLCGNFPEDVGGYDLSKIVNVKIVTIGLLDRLWRSEHSK